MLSFLNPVSISASYFSIFIQFPYLFFIFWSIFPFSGPPGTGKTSVACAVVRAWNNMDRSGKILVVADSNVAADNLTEGLADSNVRCVRIGRFMDLDDQASTFEFVSIVRQIWCLS